MEGRCTCGAIRYRLEAAPMFVHACHCTWCQRETGAPCAVNALIETDRVTLLAGEPESVTVPTASGRGQRIVRCPTCRIALWSHYAYGRIGELVAFVRVGTLDVPGEVPPDIHIFTASKLPWVVLSDAVPVMSGFYKAGEHWPEASLARRAALYDQLG